jgi:hypothetical protein
MELRIKFKDILIGVWLNGNKGYIIISPGLPQYIDKHHSVIKKLSQMGYNIFTPRYIGSWESDANFSLKNCIETIDQTIEMVGLGKAIESFDVSEVSWLNNLPISLIGFSFGALPVLLSKNDARKILVCPFVNMAYHTVNSGGEDMEHTFKFLHRGYPNVYRLNVSEIMKELKDVKYPENNSHLTIVAGLQDKVIPLDEVDFISKKYPSTIYKLPMAHSLNDIGESDLKVLLK